MNPIKVALAAVASLSALSAVPAGAVTINNPTNSYGFAYLTGGTGTAYVGQTFTSPIAGNLTNFQFTLNTSTLGSLYGVVFGWDGANPTQELWRSSVVAATPGLHNFNPTGVALEQGATYVAFLATYGLDGNSGQATVGSCLTFVGCNSNAIPNLGTLVWGNVYPDGVIFTPSINNSYDATFSATIEAAAVVPEPASWALMIGGIVAAGAAMRRRKAAVSVRYA